MVQHGTLVRSTVWPLQTLLLLHLPSTSIVSIHGMWSFVCSASFTALHFRTYAGMSQCAVYTYIHLCIYSCSSAFLGRDCAMRQVGAPFPVYVCPAAERRHLESEGAYGKLLCHKCIQLHDEAHHLHDDSDSSSRLLPQVCTVFAESLLQSKPNWQQEEFMDAWLNSVPQVLPV